MFSPLSTMPIRYLSCFSVKGDSPGEQSRASHDGDPATEALEVRLYNRRLERVSTEPPGVSVCNGISCEGLRLGAPGRAVYRCRHRSPRSPRPPRKGLPTLFAGPRPLF